MRTTNPKLVRKWSRAVRVLSPSDDVKLKAATKKAIQGDGTINPLSINLSGGFIILPLFEDSNVVTSSTTDWMDHLVKTVDLGGGIWNLTLITMARIGNTSNSNVDVKQQLNGIDGADFVTHIGTSTGSLGVFLPNTFISVSAEEPIEVKTLFKSDSTGTSNMRNDLTLLIGMRQ